MAKGEPRRVDHAALRTNQAAIILLLLAAFVLDLWWLVAFVSAVMLVGTLAGRPGFALVYFGIVRPLRIARPDVRDDNPEPHRFAQGFGGIVAAAAAILLTLGEAAAGWVLAWLVIVLAALNLLAGFCAGSAVYSCLNRMRAPGFTRSPPAGTFPGMRPPA